MDAQLMIRTHRPDLRWLKTCLKSVQKFWKSSYRPVIVATPDCQNHIPHPEAAQLRCKPFFEPPLPDQRRGSQYIAINSDKYCESEVILITDSDCVFKKATKADDFFEDGKIIVRGESYETVTDPVNQWCLIMYKRVIAECLGLEAKYECMRHHPFIFRREDFEGLRNRFVKISGKPYTEALAPYESGHFSEFNMMATYCLECTDAYRIKPGLLWGDQHVRQFHSWTQSPTSEHDEIAKILA